MTQAPIPDQLDDLAALVATGPVDLGAYTQAEMAVVLGEAPALAGVQDEVLAEAVRALAARGLLHRTPGQASVEVVGDLGLIVALVASSVGALDVRRGHAEPPDRPWRWLVSVFANGVVGVDRIDALGLHRLSLHSSAHLARTLAERLIDGRAHVPADGRHPTPVTDEQVRRVAEQAQHRYQLIMRVRRPEGVSIVVDSLVLRSGETRVDLITRAGRADGYQRLAVDHASLESFLEELFALR